MTTQNHRNKIIFIPFTRKEIELESPGRRLTETALAWHESMENFNNQNRFAYSYKIPGIKIYPGNLALESVDPATYTIYILAHCIKELCQIKSTNNPYQGPEGRLTPEQTAARLVESKLPKDVMHIKVHACNSGVGTDGVKPFAAMLYVELRKKGFKFVQVTGYTVPVYMNISDGRRMGQAAGMFVSRFEDDDKTTHFIPISGTDKSPLKFHKATWHS